MDSNTTNFINISSHEDFVDEISKKMKKSFEESDLDSINIPEIHFLNQNINNTSPENENSLDSKTNLNSDQSLYLDQSSSSDIEPDSDSDSILNQSLDSSLLQEYIEIQPNKKEDSNLMKASKITAKHIENICVTEDEDDDSNSFEVKIEEKIKGSECGIIAYIIDGNGVITTKNFVKVYEINGNKTIKEELSMIQKLDYLSPESSYSICIFSSQGCCFETKNKEDFDSINSISNFENLDGIIVFSSQSVSKNCSDLKDYALENEKDKEKKGNSVSTKNEDKNSVNIEKINGLLASDNFKNDMLEIMIKSIIFGIQDIRSDNLVIDTDNKQVYIVDFLLKEKNIPISADLDELEKDEYCEFILSNDEIKKKYDDFYRSNNKKNKDAHLEFIQLNSELRSKYKIFNREAIRENKDNYINFISSDEEIKKEYDDFHKENTEKSHLDFISSNKEFQDKYDTFHKKNTEKYYLDFISSDEEIKKEYDDFHKENTEKSHLDFISSNKEFQDKYDTFHKKNTEKYYLDFISSDEEIKKEYDIFYEDNYKHDYFDFILSEETIENQYDIFCGYDKKYQKYNYFDFILSSEEIKEYYNSTSYKEYDNEYHRDFIISDAEIEKKYIDYINLKDKKNQLYAQLLNQEQSTEIVIKKPKNQIELNAEIGSDENKEVFTLFKNKENTNLFTFFKDVFILSQIREINEINEVENEDGSKKYEIILHPASSTLITEEGNVLNNILEAMSSDENINEIFVEQYKAICRKLSSNEDIDNVNILSKQLNFFLNNPNKFKILEYINESSNKYSNSEYSDSDSDSDSEYSDSEYSTNYSLSAESVESSECETPTSHMDESDNPLSQLSSPKEKMNMSRENSYIFSSLGNSSLINSPQSLNS